MKQRTKITCLVGAGLIFFGSVLFFISWMLGADVRDAQLSFTIHSHSFTEQQGDDTITWEDNLIRLSGNISVHGDAVNDINIDWTLGEIEIKESKDSDIYFFESTERQALTENNAAYYECIDGQLNIYDTKNSVNYNLPKKKLTLYLPNLDALYTLGIDTVSADVEIEQALLSSLNISTTSGDISCEDITVINDTYLDTTSGDIEFKGSSGDFSASTSSGETEVELNDKAESITLNSSSGDIDLNHSGCGTMQVETASGEIELTASAGYTQQLDVFTTSGTVSLSDPFLEGSFYSSSGDLRISCGSFSRLVCETTSGDVTIKLPENIGTFNVCYETTSGKLYSEFPLTVNIEDGSHYRYLPNGSSSTGYHDDDDHQEDHHAQYEYDPNYVYEDEFFESSETPEMLVSTSSGDLKIIRR